MKIKFQKPILIEREKPADNAILNVLCYHCGKTYPTTYGNLRIPNYCNQCR
jgi:hypothetical protein